MKESFADILDNIEKRRTSKLKAKLPGWELVEGLVLPDNLALEQCSGSAAAAYKASVAARFTKNESPRIADLTGGLGVDSLAFSKLGGEVLYNERDQSRADAAANNFRLFNASNISVSCKDIRPDEHDWMHMLEQFLPELVYLDPARRDSVGKKVFRLEDCSPDVSTLLPWISTVCPKIMLKLSPMADLTLLSAKLPGLQEIHVVQSGGEVKELLCLIDSERGNNSDPLIVVSSLSGELRSWSFHRSEEELCSVRYADNPRTNCWLYEPEAALAKAGAFKLPCSTGGIVKAAPSTHLYFSSSAISREGIAGFLKAFRIVEFLPLSKAGLKEAGRKYPLAEVSSRNVPMSSEELRRRIGCKSGAEYHIFGFSTASDRLLAVCSRV